MTTALKAVAAVTGGSAGIGLTICEQLLAEGCTVVSLARRRCPLDHPKLHSIEVDLLDRVVTAEAVAELARRFDVTTL
ncbi:MAG: SDR family NAD(P)-dependent oxidoreductase, partial [Caldimonas sp.]